MLDAFIIEEIKRQEEARRREQERERSRPSLPIPDHRPPASREGPAEKRDRGVVIVDFSV